MLQRVEDLADVARIGDAGGRGLVMDDADRLDLVRLVGGQPGLDLLEVGAVAPVARDEINVELELVGNAMKPFCEQLTLTSTFHSSCR